MIVGEMLVIVGVNQNTADPVVLIDYLCPQESNRRQERDSLATAITFNDTLMGLAKDGGYEHKRLDRQRSILLRNRDLYMPAIVELEEMLLKEEESSPMVELNKIVSGLYFNSQGSITIFPPPGTEKKSWAVLISSGVEDQGSILLEVVENADGELSLSMDSYDIDRDDSLVVDLVRNLKNMRVEGLTGVSIRTSQSNQNTNDVKFSAGDDYQLNYSVGWGSYDTGVPVSLN